ncbi:hypothetical protein ILYODFUR_037139 [Ilyodon furcidens]|uniref:CD3 gamma/delta subunit Ig-like domain-containing protein n=1 Tax=Ilyodon furcidens TaxID=33524 RepID=A0ABV0TU62_9TELE
MPDISVQAVFVIFLMFATTVKTQEEVKGEVTFWRKSVTVKCTDNSEVYLVDKSTESLGTEYEFEYNGQVEYMCKLQGNKTPYRLYIKGRTCDNCFELNAKFFLMIIIVDLFGTVGVMIIIYSCSKNKSSDRNPKPTKTTPKTGSRGPPIPSPDYAPLNHHTLSTDTYSSVNTPVVNRTG